MDNPCDVTRDMGVTTPVTSRVTARVDGSEGSEGTTKPSLPVLPTEAHYAATPAKQGGLT